MKSFKSFVLVAVLAVGGIAGVAAIDSPVAGTQRAEAGRKYFYCDVSLTMNGKVHRGYLGGYTSRPQAEQMYKNWARGVGPKYRPRLNRIFEE